MKITTEIIEKGLILSSSKKVTVTTETTGQQLCVLLEFTKSRTIYIKFPYYCEHGNNTQEEQQDLINDSIKKMTSFSHIMSRFIHGFLDIRFDNIPRELNYLIIK